MRHEDGPPGPRHERPSGDRRHGCRRGRPDRQGRGRPRRARLAAARPGRTAGLAPEALPLAGVLDDRLVEPQRVLVRPERREIEALARSSIRAAARATRGHPALRALRLAEAARPRWTFAAPASRRSATAPGIPASSPSTSTSGASSGSISPRGARHATAAATGSRGAFTRGARITSSPMSSPTGSATGSRCASRGRGDARRVSSRWSRRGGPCSSGSDARATRSASRPRLGADDRAQARAAVGALGGRRLLVARQRRAQRDPRVGHDQRRARPTACARLLGDVGLVCARGAVGRTAKSTKETHWLRVAGADQVERALVPRARSATVPASSRRSRGRRSGSARPAIAGFDDGCGVAPRRRPSSASSHRGSGLLARSPRIRTLS